MRFSLLFFLGHDCHKVEPRAVSPISSTALRCYAHAITRIWYL